MIKTPTGPNHNVKGTHIIADSNSTAPDPDPDRTNTFRAIPLYDAQAEPDPFARLYDKLYQLDALLSVSYDLCGRGGLRERDNQTQNNYLFACSELAHDSVVLIEHYREKIEYAERAARRAGSQS